ncbi:regulatory signaling modulator protein AmpE [Pseudomonas sp. N040]|uniref:regulatory signaling modulator protein AmpE n=1 Tax=Pseudomonas sp. N040 TaxID=2785325 RepID=UPI0018A2FE27|nr:regulatory signaling modulator protein AmpE [Pseudomonas sp. N040]MBF7730272.1 regulatory signaling modulator protein AmpE [Pseudomonas sp. N040]MBW7013914.1 regulatory signaling modulator protein AmpE [Pseudomonas sp. N040]
MSFLVLLLALLVEKFSGWRQRIQRDGLWLHWLASSEANSRLASAPELTLGLLVLVPVALLGLLLLALAPLLYGWLALPVHLLVMMYCLGRGDVLATLGPFRDAWRRGDEEAAYLVAARDLGVDGEDDAQLLRNVQGYLLWEGYQGFFAVIFWYALLGPLPALAYRLLAMTEAHAAQPPLRQQAMALRHALDWLPVRVLALSFGLAGNFVAVMQTLLHELLSWEIPAARLLLDTGLAGAEVAEPAPGDAGVASLDAIWQLLIRCAVVWYGALAIATLLWLR